MDLTDNTMKWITLKWIAPFVCGLCAAGCVAAQVVAVPPGSAVILDGVLEDAEWRTAREEPLTGGGSVFLMHDDAHLYIGLRGLAEGWSHVYLPEGDDVRVLHASAALGSVRYEPDAAGAAQPDHPFSWALRDTSLGEAAAERAAFLDEHGWVASTGRMGRPNEIEFKVAKSALQEGRLAVVFASDAKAPQYWPSTLSDDTLEADLLFGNTPEDLGFQPATWARLSWQAAAR
jgi:hypothetical protein